MLMGMAFIGLGGYICYKGLTVVVGDPSSKVIPPKKMPMPQFYADDNQNYQQGLLDEYRLQPVNTAQVTTDGHAYSQVAGGAIMEDNTKHHIEQPPYQIPPTRFLHYK